MASADDSPLPVTTQSDSERIGWMTGAMTLGVFLSAFFGPLDINADGAPMKVGLDVRVVLKLLVTAYCSLLSLYGILRCRQTRSALVSIPGFLVACLLCLAIPSAVLGGSSSALPIVLINLSYLVFVPTCLAFMGVRRFIAVVLSGILCLMVFAWFLYFAFPRYGVFPELLDDGLVVKRLGGIAHPNSVGRLAVLGLIVVVYLRRDFGVYNVLSLMIVALLVSVIVGAQSRTAVAGGLAAFVVLFHDRILTRVGIALTAAVSFAMMFALFNFAAEDGRPEVFIDRAIAAVSKSGSAEEITSGTGRVNIWAKSVQLISEKPLTGHGFGSAAVLLEDFSQSTHNSVLHAAMVGGIGGGLLMIVLQGWLIVVIISVDNLVIRALAMFLIISGLMEDTVLETFPGPASMFWLACCLYPVCWNHTADVPTPAQSAETG